jgi:ribosomal protein L29
MNINEFKNESVDFLKSKLVSLYKEKMQLRFEKINEGELKKTHLLKMNRRNIARVLTLISERNR